MKGDRLGLSIIGLLSVAVPVLVAVIIYVPEPFRFSTYDFSFLTHLNATLNSATAVCLILGYVFIKQKKIKYHKTAMFTAFALSSLFLISYVVYHTQVPETKFGGEGFVRYVYFFVLITHIILSGIIVPLVLTSIYFAITNRIDKHKKIVKFTWPIWTYVAFTGVIVYWMIRPYYNF